MRNNQKHGVQRATSDERRARPRGFSLPVVAILIGLVFAFAYVAIQTSLVTNEASRLLTTSLTAQQIAEAGMQKAIYCFNATVGTNCGGVNNWGNGFAGETDVSYGKGRYTTTVDGTGPTRTVTSVGTGPGGKVFTVAMDVTLIPPTDSTNFSYALEVGDGGASMGNNSSVTGTVYSNNDIICSNTAVIDGDAYVGKAGGKISNCKVNYDAHADSVLNSKISKDAYYMTDPSGVSGSTVGGTKHPNSATPAAAASPSIDLGLWRNWASAGGTVTGPLTLNGTVHYGPKKITGDLTTGNGAHVILDGPLWVTGNFHLANNASVTLNSNFGAYSTAILADDQSDLLDHGKVILDNNTSVSGSGNPNSHLMFISTNSSMDPANPAIYVSNNANSVILYALNGIINVNNNASAEALSGRALYVSPNANITYNYSDMSSQLFSNSPSTVWHMVTGSWREIK